MSTAKIVLVQEDVFQLSAISAEEAIGRFGKDFLAERGLEVTKEFAEKLERVKREVAELQDELMAIRHQSRVKTGKE